MLSIKVKEGQSIFDIAIQQFGNAEAVVDIALYNNVSLTDNLLPGQVLKIPPSIFKNIDILDYYKKKDIAPATAQLRTDIEDIVASLEPPADDESNTTFSREYTIEYKSEFGNQI